MKKYFLIALIYSLIYFFLATALINPEGTGTALFLSPLPTWILLFVALYLVNKLNNLRNRIFFIILLFSHYVFTIYSVLGFWGETYKGESRLVAEWKRGELWMVFTIAWYLLGQLYLWIKFFKVLNNKEM